MSFSTQWTRAWSLSKEWPRAGKPTLSSYFFPLPAFFVEWDQNDDKCLRKPYPSQLWNKWKEDSRFGKIIWFIYRIWLKKRKRERKRKGSAVRLSFTSFIDYRYRLETSTHSERRFSDLLSSFPGPEFPLSPTPCFVLFIDFLLAFVKTIRDN